MAKKTKSAGDSTQAVRGVDLGEVERLLEFMQKHQLEQFEYEGGGVRILLKKAPAQASAGSRPTSVAAPMASAAVAQADPVTVHEGSAKPEVKTPDAQVHVVKSPIVGTFYAAPSPDAEPFVAVGTRVEQGQVLCIIEAMKLMNEIEADAAGEIVEIFVENGNPVEYGERLFSIRTGRKK